MFKFQRFLEKRAKKIFNKISENLVNLVKNFLTKLVEISEIFLTKLANLAIFYQKI